MPNHDRICLVACVKEKRDAPAPAKDLYRSAWFRKARRYVEQSGGAWFILSDKHGLVHPDAELAPYEKDIRKMPVGECRAWACMVQQQMDAGLPPAGAVVILAGLRYREYLIGYLAQRFGKVSIPMEGLRIGEQRQWLNRAIAAGRSGAG